MLPGYASSHYSATAIMHCHLHVFQDGHGFEWTHNLMGASHALLYQRRGAHACNIFTAEVDLAGGRPCGAGDQAEQSCLAGAIRPDKAADLLFRNIKAYVLQRRHAPKVLGQRLDFQNLHFFS